MNALAPPDARNVAIQCVNLPLRKSFTKARGNHKRHSWRHNPLGILPATDQMVVLGHKFSGFPDPKRLTHTPPAFDSQFGKSISRPQSFPKCEQLTSISFARDPDAQGPGSAVAPDSRPTSPPDTP